VNVSINPTTAGTMYLTVTCKQKLPLEKTVTVVQGTPQPYLSIQSVYIDDGGNHQLEPGEAANVYVTLRNAGNAQATAVQGRLRTASSYITLNDSTSSYGTINAGDTSRGDQYRVTAAPGTPPGTVVDFTTHVTSDQGTWDPAFQITIGTPPQPGAVFMTHDTGYCKLSVTALGSIGFTEPPALDAGVGFCYPKAGASQLFYSSLLVGNATNYVVDHFFGNPPSGPPNTDWRLADSVRAVIPPGTGDEHYRAVYTDAAHATPKSIKVTQHSYQVAAAGYDDFAILVFDVLNEGASPATGLYAGVWSDFDIGSNPTANTAASDTVRRLIYMRQSSSANPTVGTKILAPTSFRNLTAVDHARYVYPDSCVTDNQKYRFLNGTIVQRNSSRPYDWSVVASVGPFDLSAGASQRFAVAFVGGTSEAVCQVNADSAQSWYDRNVGIVEEGTVGVRGVARLSCVPNPFTNSVRISYQVPTAGRVKVDVFDISGRSVATLVDGEQPAGRTSTNWNARNLASGVYLVKVTLPGGATTEKLMLLR
ncbi:T9SS type A sorting domain-containing protein, partial [candidate division WOR-3 bacterium]|nr:T9SS type A sorting domain-containing protein [candidate division WOR-3 bacterium]